MEEEEEEDGPRTPFWEGNGRYRRRSDSHGLLSTRFFTPGRLFLIFLIIAASFVFICVLYFIQFATRIFEENLVMKSWDSLNLLFVLFAIICGFLPNTINNQNPSSYTEVPNSNDNHFSVSDRSRREPTDRGSSSSYSHPSFVSKNEHIDRLSVVMEYHLMAFNAKSGKKIASLLKRKTKLIDRKAAAEIKLTGLESKRMRLKMKVNELSYKADGLINWLRVNDPKNNPPEFGLVDYESRGVSEANERLATDKAIEDCIFVLDEAIGKGILSFDAYIKQIRSLAREQFSYRSKRKPWKPPANPPPPRPPAPPPPRAPPPEAPQPPPEAPPPAPSSKQSAPQSAPPSAPRRAAPSADPAAESPAISETMGNKEEGKIMKKKKKKLKKQRRNINENLESPNTVPSSVPLRKQSVKPPPPPPLQAFLKWFSSITGKNKNAVEVPDSRPKETIPTGKYPESVKKKKKLNSFYDSQSSDSESPLMAPMYPSKFIPNWKPPLPEKKMGFNSYYDSPNSDADLPFIPTSQPPPKNMETGKPPLPVKLMNLNISDDYPSSGSESMIAHPPPPPPFEVSGFKFEMRGDFVRINSISSSQCWPSEFDYGAESSIAGERRGRYGGDQPHTDVNSKADGFIEAVKDDWRLQKSNSIKRKRERTGSNLGRP